MASAAAAASTVTPDDVLQMQGPAPRFLCPINANVYNIEFTSFRIRDPQTDETYFEVTRDDQTAVPPQFPPDFDFDSLRTIHYNFPAKMLRLKRIATNLQFKNGPEPVKDFLIIERYYFRDRLIRTYKFDLVNFIIPNSVNSIDHEYDLPVLSENEMKAMLADKSGGNCSDSFYFVDGKLIMHNKAYFQYNEDE